MAHADMNIPGAWPEQPRAFGAPEPPQRPDAMREVPWSRWSSSYAARLDDKKTGFDTKLFDPNDADAYRLGPPSEMPDYHQIIEKYGLQVLEAAGFLNHKVEAVSGDITGRLAFAQWRNPCLDVDQWIHPVLRSEMWINVTDRQYSLMKPALLLASAILDDPVTLNYFHALSMPAASMDTISHISRGLIANCKIMTIPETLSPEQQQAVYKKLCNMRNFTHWGFERSGVIDGMGYTEPLINGAGNYIPATKPRTMQSKIRLRTEYIRVLEDYAAIADPEDESYNRIYEDSYTMAGIHPSRRPPISHVSAIYRTGLSLAATMLHELTHAFTMAYFETTRSKILDNPCEPWVRGDRANEQGWAFENYAFGGVVYPYMIGIPPIHHDFVSYLQHIAAPFGLWTSQQWDVWMSNEGDFCQTMDFDRQDDDEEWPENRVYPVPQAWTQWLYSDDLWKDQIHRYGLSVIKVPKLRDWEVPIRCTGDIGYWQTGEDRWNTGEKIFWSQNWT
ncbi:hypothetical protein QM012_000096 [Aureobasidium pullulans]|uniref:Uncharacterized protein n=1 Tax=Aureobasidium pullulans TaxID=5580 RepID=A0ABR0TUR0_AURPU